MGGIKAIHFSYSIGVGMSGALLIWMEDLAMQMIDLRSGHGWAGQVGGAARAALSAVGTTLRVWWRIMRTRRGLEEMDARMLADLGISQAQATFQLSRAPWTLARGVVRR